MSDNINPMVDFGAPEKENTIIKVIGVGGGGGNAVNHTYREGIHDVSFVLCNTDMQALNDSPVPMKLQLGKEGLGAATSQRRRVRLPRRASTTSSRCSATARR